MAASRQAVQKGGIFGASQPPAYSKETQELLKVMMAESKLTNFQRRKINETMSGGRPLPSTVHPTSSQVKQRPIVNPAPQTKFTMRGQNTPGLRTIESIERSGAYEREQYIPKPTKSMANEKERLSNFMAFGEELPPPVKSKKPAAKEIPFKDRFEELQEEIEERQSFLQQMKDMGQGKKYEPIIATQISQLIREMEDIDKKRTKDLEQAMANNS